jgi:alcohol oxidase
MLLIRIRPSASDFDDWKTEGWTAHDMLPMMKKCEEYQCWPDDPLHGYDGPLGVSYGGTKLNLAQEWLETAALRGIPIRKDLQDLATGFGSYHWPKWIDGKTGRRSDTAHAYIHAQQNAPNLCVLVTTHVSRVLVEGDTAVAVECVANPEFRKDGGKPFVVRARRSIVIAAGALASPGILERSGIGSPEILKAAGVKPLTCSQSATTTRTISWFILPMLQPRIRRRWTTYYEATRRRWNASTRCSRRAKGLWPPTLRTPERA